MPVFSFNTQIQDVSHNGTSCQPTKHTHPVAALVALGRATEPLGQATVEFMQAEEEVAPSKLVRGKGHDAHWALQ